GLAGGEGVERVGGRNAAILYGLGNLLENAVDFARERVEVAASWNPQDVAVTITDDGPGFAPEIMDRIGEPYVTSRRRERQPAEGEAGGIEARGLGLVFFTAQPVLEPAAATLNSQTGALPDGGGVGGVNWAPSAFERPPAFEA